MALASFSGHFSRKLLTLYKKQTAQLIFQPLVNHGNYTAKLTYKLLLLSIEVFTRRFSFFILLVSYFMVYWALKNPLKKMVCPIRAVLLETSILRSESFTFDTSTSTFSCHNSFQNFQMTNFQIFCLICTMHY